MKAPILLLNGAFADSVLLVESALSDAIQQVSSGGRALDILKFAPAWFGNRDVRR